MGANVDNLPNRTWLKITLLLTGSLTVMSGAVITAAIPDIKANFDFIANAELYSKLILTLPSLFIAVVAPFAGKLIDKSGRKRVLLWSLLFYAIGGTSGFYLSNIYLLLLGRSVLGISVAGIMTINTTLIGDYFREKVRSNFMGWQGAFMGFGGVLFVSSGGLLADISWRWPFVVYALSLILLVMARKFLYEPQISHTSNKPDSDKIKSSKKKTYIKLYFTAFFGMLFFYLIPTQVPFLLEEKAVMQNSAIGFTISAAILAGAIVSMVYGKIRRRFSFHQIFVFTFLLMGCGYLITASATDYWGILTGLIIAGLGTGLFMPNTNLWLVWLAPAEKRGRMVGMLNTAVYCGQFFSPVFVSPLNGLVSINFSFLVCGILMLLMAGYFYYLHFHSEKQISVLERE